MAEGKVVGVLRACGGMLLASTYACAVDDRVVAVSDDTEQLGSAGVTGTMPGQVAAAGGSGGGAGGSGAIAPNAGLGGSGAAPADVPVACSANEQRPGCVSTAAGAGGQGGGSSTPASGSGGSAMAAGAGAQPAVTPSAPPPPVSLTINGAGSGSLGIVSVEPLGLSCSSPPCTFQVPVNTRLELRATTNASSGDGIASWSGGGCSGVEDCVLVPTADTSVTVAYEPANIVFVSSVSSTANLGGLAGADALCAGLARNAGLPGSFIALLPDDGVNAFDRLGNSRGWARPDGKLVADTLDDFRAGRVFYPLRVDERRADVGDVRVMTGMAPGGDLAIPQGASSCESWTSERSDISYEVSSTALMGDGFMTFGSNSCSGTAPLYCASFGRSVRVAPTPVLGRFAFTSRPVTIGIGITALDLACQSEALAAGLPGSYLALVATSTTSAASRFDLSGLPWVRPDGIRIAPSAAALIQSDLLESAANVSADGLEFNTNDLNWFGATSLTTIGSLDTTCNDWRSSAGTASGGRSGMSSLTALLAFDAATDCNFTFGVLTCLQQ